MDKSLFFLLALFVCCKSNDDPVMNIPSMEPSNVTVERFEPVRFAEGDTITLFGSHLDTARPFEVKFGNLAGRLFEISSDEASLIVPKGAESDNLILVTGDSSTIIGPYQMYLKSAARLFGLSSKNRVGYFYEIDVNTGEVIREIGSLPDGINYRTPFRFMPASDELCANMFVGSQNGRYAFFSLNVETREGNLSYIDWEEFEGYGVKDFIIRDTTVYSYRENIEYRSDKPRFELMTPWPEGAISIVHEFENIALNDTPFIFSKSSDEILGCYQSLTSSEIGILRLNLLTKEEIRLASPHSANYKNLIITLSNRLFCLEEHENGSRLIEIDLDTGQEIATIRNLDTNSDYDNFQFSESTNELVGLAFSKEWPRNYYNLVRIHVETGERIEIPLDTTPILELILVNPEG